MVFSSQPVIPTLLILNFSQTCLTMSIHTCFFFVEYHFCLWTSGRLHVILLQRIQI